MGDIDSWLASHVVSLSVSRALSRLSALVYLSRRPLAPKNFPIEENFQAIDTLLSCPQQGQWCQLWLCCQKETAETHWNVLLTSSPVKTNQYGDIFPPYQRILTISYGRYCGSDLWEPVSTSVTLHLTMWLYLVIMISFLVILILYLVTTISEMLELLCFS